jgi:hypothetical protein
VHQDSKQMPFACERAEHSMLGQPHVRFESAELASGLTDANWGPALLLEELWHALPEHYIRVRNNHQRGKKITYAADLFAIVE